MNRVIRSVIYAVYFIDHLLFGCKKSDIFLVNCFLVKMNSISMQLT